MAPRSLNVLTVHKTASATAVKGATLVILRRTIFALAMLLASVGALRAIGADSETEAFIRDVIKDARTDSHDSSAVRALPRWKSPVGLGA